MQNGFANFSGILGPALTGFLVDRTGNFQAALAVTAAVLVLGGIGWVFDVGPLQQVSWPLERQSSSATGAV